MRDVGKDSFVRSIEIRKDEVYSRILQEMISIDLTKLSLPTSRIQITGSAFEH
jgi:hypothetical protein